MESGDTNARKDERIYSKQLKMLLKSAIKEERYSNLTVDADLQACNGALFHKELMIRITDEGDPLFFYHMRLNDDDYQALRLQQGFLVDFVAFPQKFIDLLELCRQEEEKHKPRFVVQLSFSESQGGVQLSVVEVNDFKLLFHLSLKLVAGTDNEVKRFLASYVTSVKTKNEKLHNLLQSTQTELGSSHRECDRLQNELRDKSAIFHSRMEQQVNRENDRVLQVERSLHDKHDRDLREKELSHFQEVSQLKSTVATLNAQVADVDTKRHYAESLSHELQKRLDDAQGELKQQRQESLKLNRDAVQLQRSHDELERHANQRDGQVATLELHLKERDSHLGRLQHQIQSLYDEKAMLTSDLEKRQSSISHRDVAIKKLSDEMNKANAIIQKLQNEMRALRDTAKSRGQLVLAQEKVMSEKEMQVEVTKSRLATVEERNNHYENEVKRLQETLNESQTRLEENAKSLKKNDELINYLNKQLNDAQSNLRKTETSASHRGVPFGVMTNLPNQYATSTPTVAAAAFTSPVSSGNIGSAEKAQSGMRRSPFSTIPEESHIVFPASSPGDRENNPPLDPKYLRPHASDSRVQGSSSSSNSQSRPRMVSNLRLPQTSIAPRATTKGTDSRGFPQSSAYFQS